MRFPKRKAVRISRLLLITPIGLAHGLIAGCQSAPPAAAPAAAAMPARTYSAVELKESQRQVIEIGLRAQLKDPESARFGAMRATVESESGEILNICGFVNAKNSFGGYTGMQPFFGLLHKQTASARGGFAVISIGGERVKNLSIGDTCAQRGIKF